VVPQKRGTLVSVVARINLSSMLTVSPTDRVFILAGAGVSAESGIPTFRGVGGLWRNYRIEEVVIRTSICQSHASA
jgi:NAD-dependent SIR2 family protein deacetylase